MKKLPYAFAFLGLMTAVAAAADTVVNVGATGANRDAAIQQALGEATVTALGAQVFTVSTMTAERFTQMSTAVTSGRISGYDVIDEYETPQGIHVRLVVRLSDGDIASIAPVGAETWSDRIERTHSMDAAQRTVSNYRRSLNEFLIGPRHQLEVGYSFVLRSYEIESVGSSRVQGQFHVDVIVNEPWWNTYYQLVGAMTPQGQVTVPEGPLQTGDRSAFVDPDRSSPVDASLQYDLAHPLPVRLRIGDRQVGFTLYKNALMTNARPVALDSAQSLEDERLALRGEIAFDRGNAPAGDAVVNRSLSAVDCGAAIRHGAAVYCGSRFTLAIPFELANESEIVRVAAEGVRVEMALFGNAKEAVEKSGAAEDSDAAAFRELLQHVRSKEDVRF